MYRLLIADDEIKIREVIAEYGRINNYSVMEASDGLQAIEMVEKHDFDCVILDIMMPNLDGYTACKRIKEIKNVPIIILSARQQEDDKLYGFELGIDDYVTKPFSPRELMARIKVVIERSNKARKTQEKEVIKYEGITVNIPSHEVTIDGNDIHLTNKEFDLLVYYAVCVILFREFVDILASAVHCRSIHHSRALASGHIPAADLGESILVIG